MSSSARGPEALLTIPGLFAAAVERAPEKPWLFYATESYTFEQARQLIAGAATALVDLGVHRGTLVMATTRNTADYLFTWLAAAHLGAIWLAVDPRGTSSELAGFAHQARPHLVITDAELRAAVDEAVRETDQTARSVLVTDLFEEPSTDAPPVAARPDDVAVLIPTSGTTGRSKLVMQTQRAYTMAGEGFPYWLELTESDRLMTSLPLFHINAQAYSTLGSIAAGAGLALLPRFSASRFLDEARRYGATEFNAIGAMIEILMRQPERDDDADNPLRLCYTGPAPPEERHLEFERRFGLRIVCGYALSETPYALVWKHGTRPFGTLGSVRQHPVLGEINEARVRLDDGGFARPGETGELELKNPAIMRGYLGMPEATEEAIVDGWLRTGDLVTVNEDGTYTFVARKKEVIRRRGENLSPSEVEAALESHPGVLEAAVVGVPSELTEEDVKAFVVLKDADTPMTELRAWVAERLARFKVPRYFEVADHLPHTPTGRIAKHELPRDRRDTEEDLAPPMQEAR